MELDQTDRRILNFLQKNGRATNLELAQAVHLSPAQALRRHRRLEELGAITGYDTRLNAENLGFGVVVFIHVTMELGHIRNLSEFKALVADLPQVQECFTVTGEYDFILKVVERDLKSLSIFLQDTLMLAPGVSAVKSLVCLDEIKCTSAIPVAP
jgi:DNA-binding Lrp family transcriptional regulator